MRLVHERGDTRRTLASTVETADSFLSRARGLMGRDVPDDYALVFRFGRPAGHGIHMLFVREPLDVLWVVDGEVTERARLRPWVGFGRARADTVVELPAGAAADVEPGDSVRVVEDGRGD